MVKQIRFKVPNIVCGSCAGIIESVLKQIPNLSIPRVEVYVEDKIVEITMDDSTAQLHDANNVMTLVTQALSDVSFDVMTIDPDPVSPDPVAANPHKKEKPNHLIRDHLIKGLLGTLCGLALMIICACGLSLPLFAMCLIGGMSTLLTLILGWDTYKSTAVSLFKYKTWSMEALFTVSTLTAIGISIASIFVPWLPMLFDAALLIFGFRHIGIAIEEKAKRKIMDKSTFKDSVPKEIEVEEKETKRIVVKLVKDLQPGDVIIVRKGKKIPVDGICENKSSYVYKANYTGDQYSSEVKKGDELVAGMIADGHDDLKVTVTKTEADSFLVQGDKKRDEAHKSKAPIEEIAAKILRYFVPAVLGLAIVAGILVGVFFTPALALQCAISILVSACPCTLGFVVPLAIRTGISKGIENGIHFTNGKHLQSAAKINAMVFDLNGTLTKGTPEVKRMIVNEDCITEDEMKEYLHLLEQPSQHAIGRTIYLYTSTSKNIEKPSRKNVIYEEIKSHSGVRGIIEGKKYTIGNRNMMHEHGIDFTEYEAKLALQHGEYPVFFARDQRVIGAVILNDPLRDDAKRVVQQLKKNGVESFICTGTDKETASATAAELGIPSSNVYSDCIPFDKSPKPNDIKKISKTYHIQQLQKRGYKVGMLGDANNDVFAVEASDFGIAIKSNSEGEKTYAGAGATIKGSSLQPVVSALAIAKQTARNIKISLAVSLTYNVASLLIAGGLLLAIGFTLNPAIGVALMVVQACVLLGIAYYYKRKQIPKSEENATAAPAHQGLSTPAFLGRIFRFRPSAEPAPEQRQQTSSFPGFLRRGRAKPAQEVTFSLSSEAALNNKAVY